MHTGTTTRTGGRSESPSRCECYAVSNPKTSSYGTPKYRTPHEIPRALGSRYPPRRERVRALGS